MSRWESWVFGVLHGVLAATGGVYFVMKYVLRADDPFAVVNHPWQPFMLSAHVLSAPLGLVVFGIVFRSHILAKITSKNGSGRRSGWTSLVSFVAMGSSGYLLQVVASPTSLRVVMVAHVVTSVVFVLGYAVHLVGGLRLVRTAATFLLAVGVLAARSPADAADAGRRPSSGSRARVERRAYLMGTRVTLATFAADRTDGLRALERMLRGLEAVEADLSTWREDSLLSTVNRQPVGTSRPAPEPLCDLLGELADWRRATGGAFDPAVGSLIAVWGLRAGGRSPSAVEVAQARGDAGLEHLVVRHDPCRVTRRRDVTLDAGAFGKGEAIDRVAETVLADHSGAWMIDLGGQVAVGSGDGESWRVALAHPHRRHEATLHLDLSSGSLATSGGSVRDLEVAGRMVGHILDPRTGRPVSRAESVTVWHRRALAADVLSTALYVMGIDEGLAWAEAREIAACFLVPDPKGSGITQRATATFRRRFPPGRRFYAKASTRPARVARPSRSPERVACASRSRSPSERTKRE